jgi:hypothetical protein
LRDGTGRIVARYDAGDNRTRDRTDGPHRGQRGSAVEGARGEGKPELKNFTDFVADGVGFADVTKGLTPSSAVFSPQSPPTADTIAQTLSARARVQCRGMLGYSTLRLARH